MKNTLDYSLNVTEFPVRNIPNVWKPASISELREILKKASEDSRAVYPVSTGHNWGLGSKLPVKDADIIDLGEINEILEVSEDLAYARIQPGVTQKQLADYLEANHPDLILNVTGSDAHSSILGNALERGSGKNGQRASDIRELKVMCANGEELSTGFGSFSENRNPSFYRYGLGPDITHLFTQSNLGVVTEGVINLMPKQDFTLYLAQVSHDNLGDFFKEFSYLVRKGITGYSLEVDSQNDPKIFELFEEVTINSKYWICWFVIYGSKEVRKAKDNEAQTRLAELSEFKTYSSTEDHSSAPPPVTVRISRYSGVPNDHSLISTARAFGVDLNEDNPDIDLAKELPGFRCVLPVIPFSKEGVEVINRILQYSASTEFEPAISVIALDDYSMEVFARVYFNRNDSEQIQNASEWAAGLLSELKKDSIFPYRLDVENMQSYLSSVNDEARDLKNCIKQFLDPEGIIAPGRYHLISNI